MTTQTTVTNLCQLKLGMLATIYIAYHWLDLVYPKFYCFWLQPFIVSPAEQIVVAMNQ